jgi:hypothetical protein
MACVNDKSKHKISVFYCATSHKKIIIINGNGFRILRLLKVTIEFVEKFIGFLASEFPLRKGIKIEGVFYSF